MDSDSIVSLLRSYRFRVGSEKQLQDGIEKVLETNAITYLREHSLSASDRPDFMIEGRVAVEVKIDGSLAGLLRQASRYTAHDTVNSIIVIGTPHWLPRVPAQLNGKAVHSIRIVSSLL